MSAGDGYIRKQGTRWTIGTASVEKTVALEGGKFLLKSFKDPATAKEFLPDGVESPEFAVTAGDAGRITGASGGWRLAASTVRTVKQGEKELDISLKRGALQVTKSYVVYPGSSVIREWVTFTNAGEQPLLVVEPSFLNLSMRPDDPTSVDFNWMTGGGNEEGCWTLKTEALPSRKPRVFDSYDPFPKPVPEKEFLGDGVKARITLNGQNVWPSQEWAVSPNSTVTVPVDFTAEVRKGDQLAFIVNRNGNIGWDTTHFDPTITYDDGEAHAASAEFSDEQGKHGWRYQYLEDGKAIDLVYYASHAQWRKKVDNATGTPFIGKSNQHPDSGQDSVRLWTARKAGKVHVTGSVCNTGNWSQIPQPGFRAGTTDYAPWYALFGRDSKQGIAIGWDYFGHWASAFDVADDGSIHVELKVAGHKQTLKPGESVVTPMAFTALFKGDLDNAGNELLDWQYAYLWDYAREGWFPAIRMLGYWWKGTSWGRAGIGWLGGEPDYQSTMLKVFLMADFMRSTGADVYHRDWGWWDRPGDWNGPDWRIANEYLRKYDMGLLIYAFIYTVDRNSKVAREHPDWVENDTLDMSKPEVVEFLGKQLDSFVEKWGDFEWRNDSTFTTPRGDDDTCLLAQDHGFRQLLRTWLDKHPKCAFQAVNGGGTYAGYDYIRYTPCIQMTDGTAGLLSNYYTSMLFPPDKMCHMPDSWDPAKFDKATWHGLLCLCFDTSGMTTDPAQLDGIRQLIGIYHYLHGQGVVGRWSKVYRPTVTGDDPTMYFQRLSNDRKRGLIITKHAAPSAVTIRPKGLLPEEEYLVICSESGRQEKRTGADLMAKGLAFDKLAPGELVFLNIPMYPGSNLDTEPPAAPSSAAKKHSEYMGFPGVEVSWEPATDNNWVWYYEVFRGGKLLDEVAKGTFYFDHSAGADGAAEYEVRAVDGAGNVSDKDRAEGPATKPVKVVDDSEIAFSGAWEHKTGVSTAHAGTVSVSAEKNASAEVAFEGKRVLWFGQVGPECGKAVVSIDGLSPEIVDTYTADDIWEVCVYQKEFKKAGRHTIKITVAGEHQAFSHADNIYVDAIRVEH